MVSLDIKAFDLAWHEGQLPKLFSFGLHPALIVDFVSTESRSFPSESIELSGPHADAQPFSSVC